MSAIAASLPAAISLSGVLAGGGLAVAGSFASAGLAAAAFGAVAKPMFSQTADAMKKVTAAQLALSKASTPAARLAALKAEKQALDSLTPSELKLASALTSIKGEWKDLTTSLQPDVWRAIGPYIRTAETSMGLLPAVVRPASVAIHGIGAELQALMSSGVAQQFTQFIGGTGSASLAAGGGFLVNVLKTVMELLPQFRPLIDSADAAVVRIGADMARWAGSASASNGIQAFIGWVKANAPAAEAFLKNLGGAVVNLGKAFAAGGIGELQVLSAALKVIAGLPAGFLTPIVTGLTSIALLSKFSAGASLVNWLGRLALSATGITAAGAALKGFTVATEGATIAQKGLLATEVALEAITPFGWAVAGAAAIGALGYVLVKNSDQVGAYIDQQRKADRATGYNIAGYQKLAAQLSGSATAQNQLGEAIRNTEGPVASARDGTAAWAHGMAEANQAQDQATRTASRLGTAMQGLGARYGISETAAIRVARASGVSATAWTGSAKALAGANAQVLKWIITNDKALPPQQENNALIRAMGSSALSSAGQIDALNTSYRLLVGDFISRQQALESARQGIASIADSIRTTGIRSGATTQQIQSWIQQMPGLIGQLGDSGTALRRFIRLSQDNISLMLRRHDLSAGERDDLQRAQNFLDAVANSSRGLNSAQKAAANVIQQRFRPQLQLIGTDTSATRGQMDRLANSIQKTGDHSQSTQSDRAQLIRDLEKSGLNADEARRFVDKYITAIGRIPKSATTNFGLSGSGKLNLTEKIIGSLGGNTGVGVVLNSAQGRLVTGGTPGKDSVLLRAMPGEVVVPEPMVRAGDVDHLRGRIPGFGAGGVVGNYSGSLAGLGRWGDRAYNAFDDSWSRAAASAGYATESYIAKKLLAARKKKELALSGAGPSAPGLMTVAKFLVSRGFTDAAAAGIAGCVAGESGGNPESIGSGGGGLIGWTPMSSAYPIQPIITGNARRDMGAQLTDMLAYIQRNGSVADMNSYRGSLAAAMAAAWHFSAAYERPLVTGSDIRSGVVSSIYGALGGHAAGTGSAPRGWALTGERGRELAYFHGGETVLPNSLTERVLSGGIAMPGYAGGTADARGGGRQADLRRKEAQLAALQARASAREKTLRIPVEKDQLWLLEHPHASASQRKAREAELKHDRKILSDYRKRVGADEARLQKEITLLRHIIGRHHPGPPGKPPPGVFRGGGRKKELAELASRVKSLAGLEKRTSAHLGALRRPLEEEQLYLLLHPDISAARKRSIEADIKRRQAAISKYRKTATAEESVYQKEIDLLRHLTGEPSDKKYGGAGTGTGTKPPAHALPPPTFLTGAGGAGGFSTAGTTPVSGTITPTAAPGPAPVSPHPALAGAMSSGDPQVVMLLQSIVTLLKVAPARTSAGVAQGVSGVGRSALNRGYYSVT